MRATVSRAIVITLLFHCDKRRSTCRSRSLFPTSFVLKRIIERLMQSWTVSKTVMRIYMTRRLKCKWKNSFQLLFVNITKYHASPCEFVSLKSNHYMFIMFKKYMLPLWLKISNYSARRDLRCLRNTIHVTLFLTYIMSSSLWMLILSLQVRVIIRNAENDSHFFFKTKQRMDL